MLTLNELPIQAADLITITDLNAGSFRYSPDANENGIAYSSFTFRVQDNNIQAGINTDPVAREFTVNVLPVSDAPTGDNLTQFMLEDTDFVIGAADFGFSDNSDGDTLVAVIVDKLPESGTLLLGGTELSSSITVPLSLIESGLLLYRPTDDFHGTDTLQFRLQDYGQSTQSGLANNTSQQYTLTFDVIAVNDAPSGTDNTINTNEDSSHTFVSGDFGFTDSNDNSDNHQFTAITIISVPEAGRLSVAGTRVEIAQVITVTEIESGLLQYLPPGNQTGNGYRGFRFAVHDSGGTANNGDNIDQSANQINFDLTGVNDSPLLLSNAATLPEGSAIVIDNTMLFGSDPDDPNPGDLLLTITSLPSHGDLTLDGNPLVVGDSFTLQAILDEVFRYRHDSSETSVDEFGVALTDGGENNSVPAIGDVVFNITEVIDVAPMVDSDQLQLEYGQTFDSGAGDLLASGFTGVNNNEFLDNANFIVTLEIPPSHGTVDLQPDGTFTYVHNGTVEYEDQFRYRVTNEDGVFTIATVSISIEPPIAEALTTDTSTSSLQTEARVEPENTSARVTDEVDVDITEVEVAQTGSAQAQINFVNPPESPENSSVAVVEIIDSLIEAVQAREVREDESTLSVTQHNKIDSIIFDADGVAPMSDVSLEILIEVKVPTYKSAAANSFFLEGLNKLEEDLVDNLSESNQRLRFGEEVIFGVSFSASVGVIAWALRSGALLGSLLSAAPLWWSLDVNRTPKPVQSKKDNEKDQKNSNEVEELFEDEQNR